MIFQNSYIINYTLYDDIEGGLIKEHEEIEISAKTAEQAIAKFMIKKIAEYPFFEVKIIVHSVETHWHER